MVDIVTRAGKGSPLTNNEVDANFTNLAEVSGITGEPMGHEDRTTSTISFNASTRTFTIAPVSTSFTVWCKGKKVVVSSAQTVTIPNTSGMYSIYFDANGALAAKAGYFTFSEEAPTAYIYWNAATGACPYFGDERHGVVLDWQTHEYLHRTRGAALASGFGASGYTLGGNGSSNAHAQLTLEGGTFFDEDMKIIVTATNTPTAGTWEQDLLSPARIPVLYLSGTGWVIDAPTDYPLKQGTARPQYNALSGGVWSTADVANNKYATSWILATNNLTYPVIAIIGQAESDLQSAAEAVDFTSLQLPGFPSVEFRPLYRLVFQCADSFSNAVKASLVSITDIRSIAAAGVAASLITDHGNLSGLSDDDHPQYLSVDTVRASLTAAVKASFLPSQTGNAGKFLTTDATSTSWAALTSGNITTALGFTPYNATNPAGYITGITSSDVTTALGFTPYNATNPSGYVTAAGARGAISVTGAGSYDSATGVINIVGGVTSFNTRTGAITLSSADVTTALGFTPYNSTNPNGYLTGITSTQVTTALGYTPYNSSNPSGYITGITSGMVTTALGFTPYNNSNPSGYITSSALSGYLTSASAASTYLPLSGGTLTGVTRILGPGVTNPTTADSTDNSILSLRGNNALVRLQFGTRNTGNFAGWIQASYDNGGGANGVEPLELNPLGGVVNANGNNILHAGNYNSYAPTLTGTGASGTWGINITGTAATATSAPNYLPLSGGSLSGPLTITGNATYVGDYGYSTLVLQDSGGYPGLNYRSGSSNWLIRMSAGGSNLLWAYSSNASAQGAGNYTQYLFLDTAELNHSSSIRAPIFYDSNDTTYYVDPNSNSRLSSLSVYTSGSWGFVNAARGSNFGYSSSYGTLIYGATSGSITPCFNVDPIANPSGSFNGNGSEVMFRNGVQFISPNSSNNGYNNYFVLQDGYAAANNSFRAPIFYDTNDSSYYSDPNATSSLRAVNYWGLQQWAGNDVYAIGTPTYGFRFNNNANTINAFIIENSGTTVSYASSRAPIFYDSSDTNYYVDPNGNSVLTTATFNLNASSILRLTTAGTNASMIKAGSGDELYVGGNDTWQMRFSGANVLMDNGGYLLNGESIRSPIFYDSANTGYYVDPASTSNLVGLTVANTISGSVSGSAGSAGSVPWTGVSSGTRTNYDLGFQPPVSGFSGFYFSKSTSGSTASDAGYLLIRGTSDSFPPYTAEGITLVSDANSLNLFARGSSLVSGGNAWVRMGTNSGETFRLMSDYSLSINSSRAPIFYDSDDTSYYTSPNGNSRLYSLGLGGATPDTRLSIAGDSHFAGILHLGGTAGSVGSWGSRDYTTSGNRYFNANSYNFDNYGYGSNWTFTLSGGTGQASSSLRAPIFYDSNDTSYYVDPASRSRQSSIDFGSSGYYIHAGDWGMRNTTPYGWIQFGPANSGHAHIYTSMSNFYFNAQIQLNGGSQINTSDIRANIFYDQQDTAFYLDPHSTSVLNRISTVRTNNFLYMDNNYGHSIVGAYASTRYQGVFAMGDAYKLPEDGTTTGNLYGITWSHPNAGGAAGNLNTHGALILENGSFLAALSGSIRCRDDMRTPIYYDSNDTGYYVNPNGVSYLYGLTLAGGSYFRPNAWIQCDTSAGIYWPNHYGAHFYPNGGSTYTQLQIDGSKNGYSGMNISHSGVQGMMYDGSGNGGVYREANGRWYWYYLLANDCMGIGTSSTSSTYSLYLTKGVYAQSRIDATIFYDTNNTTYYVDPNDTGTSVRVAGNVTAYYSDMRLKTHLGKIENARDKVRQLEGFYYEANELAQSFGYKAKREVGVSAQAVQAVLPEIVTDAPINSNYLTIDYERLTPLLIEAIKEQDTELVDLRNRVAQLESLINKLIGD